MKDFTAFQGWNIPHWISGRSEEIKPKMVLWWITVYQIPGKKMVRRHSIHWSTRKMSAAECFLGYLRRKEKGRAEVIKSPLYTCFICKYEHNPRLRQAWLCPTCPLTTEEFIALHGDAPLGRCGDCCLNASSLIASSTTFHLHWQSHFQKKAQHLLTSTGRTASSLWDEPPPEARSRFFSCCLPSSMCKTPEFMHGRPAEICLTTQSVHVTFLA